MNFLAHLYLSGDSEDLMVGNFIGDSVKGRDFGHYPEEVQHGIILHRAIDRYTDDHDIVRRSTERLRTKYKKYSGVMVDIFYDHFLAQNWRNHHHQELELYVDDFYNMIQSRDYELPARTQMMLPYMMRGNWLYNYQFIEGIARVLHGMSRRTKFDSKMEEGVIELQELKDEFGNDFDEFFPELKSFAQKFIAQEEWTKF
jgi:acyl carrier protein phosphodiesterase